jgi:predicted NUDIX family NTP pyrophosphohydrolase
MQAGWYNGDMPKHSAGLLLYRPVSKGFEVLIVHPGGPFWAKRDLGSWSIPKGEFMEGEEPLVAAKREFQEEVGAPAPAGEYQSLGEAKQASGKIVHAFALASDFNLERFKSNMFEMEWPPRSGVKQEFPECDRAAWVPLATAKQKLVKEQVPLLENLAKQLNTALDGPAPESGPAQASLF